MTRNIVYRCDQDGQTDRAMLHSFCVKRAARDVDGAKLRRRAGFSRPYLSLEILNQSSAVDDGSFPPIHRFGILEIHKVFLRFPNLVFTKNLSPSSLEDGIRTSIIV